MNYNESCAAKGKHGQLHAEYAARRGQMFNRFMQRAAVNIYKTDASYEMLVFAPGRIKEHFNLDVQGNELTVSYMPPEGFPRPDWVLREYSRGGFARSFTLDDTINKEAIVAKYEDGVLQVSLPFIAGKEVTKQTIKVS